jgi:hypothetical protein
MPFASGGCWMRGRNPGEGGSMVAGRDGRGSHVGNSGDARSPFWRLLCDRAGSVVDLKSAIRARDTSDGK